jgi:hypothetical protein
VEAVTKAEDPLLVKFHASNAGDYDQNLFQWRFGDGQGTNGPEPEHRYEKGGIYFVRLSYFVSRAGRQMVEWPITVNDPPSLTIDKATIVPDTAGMGVPLEASATDAETPLSSKDIEWDFGDGTTLTGSPVEHVYSGEGTFRVSATVVDAGGAVASDQLEVEVIREIVVDVIEEEESAPEEPQEEEAPKLSSDEEEPLPPEEPLSPPIIGEEESPPENTEDDVAGSNPESGEAPPAPNEGDGELLGEEPGEEVVEQPEEGTEPPVVADALPVDEPETPTESALRLDFEEVPPWIDGTTFRHTTDAARVHSGDGALEIHSSGGAVPSSVQEAVAAMLAPFAGATELHVSWYAMANVGYTIHAEQARNAANTLSAADGPLTPQEEQVLLAVVDALTANASSTAVFVAEAWHCTTLQAVETEQDGVSGLQIVAIVNGEAVFSGFVAGVDSATALTVAVPLVLQSQSLSQDGMITWLDELRVQTTTAGCE